MGEERVVAIPSPRELLAWASALVRADHSVTADEREALVELARRAGLDEGEVEILLAQDLEDGSPAEVPEVKLALVWLDELMRVAWADGSLSKAERALLEGLSKRLGLVGADFKLALAKGRRARYRESRRAWKERGAGE